MRRERAVITLATGSQYYHRMALALMISAYKCAGDKYHYIIFSDQEELPYYKKPEWLQVIKLSARYHQSHKENNSRGTGFRIKSMILSDPAIKEYDVLFLDADCFVFSDSFERLFHLIEENSIAIYGAYAPEGELWGKLDFQKVVSLAGYQVRNMWLNSGFIGRAADPIGYEFIRQYESLMKDYPFRPFIKSKFWQVADEPYLATAFQLTFQQQFNALPDKIPSPSSDFFVTTYDATIDKKNRYKPIVHSRYIKGTFKPSIIHFLGGINIPYYRDLINETVEFNLRGKLMRPYFRVLFEYSKLKYYYKRLTDKSIQEERDL